MFIRLITLFIAVCIASLCSLCVGEMKLPFDQLIDYMNDTSSMEYAVLTHIRIPRTLLAVAIGGGLSLAGVILQGIYRNPLVEPYTLGISGGASLGVTLAIVTGIYANYALSLPFFGFVGAFLTIFLVYSLSLKKGVVSVNRMLLIGVMISFISSSMVMFLMSITASENIHGIIFWTMGSLDESNPYLVYGMLIVSVFSVIVAYLFAIPLNALRLGEAKARHLGINTQLIIRLLFVLTSLLTGSCIAVGGVIGFVGLIIPHFTRLWLGNDYRVLLLGSFLSGSFFLILCDMLARTLILPNELPIGVITGIFGGIAFIFILSSQQKQSNAA